MGGGCGRGVFFFGLSLSLAACRPSALPLFRRPSALWLSGSLWLSSLLFPSLPPFVLSQTNNTTRRSHNTQKKEHPTARMEGTHQTLRQPYIDSYVQCAYVLAIASGEAGGAAASDVAHAFLVIAAVCPSARARGCLNAAAALELPSSADATPDALVRFVCRAHALLYDQGVASARPFATPAEARRAFDAGTWYADQTKWGGLVWFVLHHIALFGHLERLFPWVSPAPSRLACCAAAAMAIGAALPCSACREHSKETVPSELENFALRGHTDALDWTWWLREAVRTQRARRAPAAAPIAWPPDARQLRFALLQDHLRPPCD